MAKAKTQDEIRKENVEAQISASEKFYNENKKTIWTILIAIVVLGIAVLAYSKFIYGPKCAEAQEQTFPAEASFAAGEWQLALEGDGNVLGFADIIKEYGKKAGKAVYMYAGVCELQLGNNEEAIAYLKKYNGKDDILAARALACIGDAYVNLENYAEAVKYFEKAAAVADNNFAAAYLFKAGIAYEALGNNAKALAAYKAIKDNYSASMEGYDIDKYITRVAE